MKVKVARIYVTEGKHVHEEIFRRLHDLEKVHGVTVFRGVSGFGNSGKIHSSTLLDISFDMPVVIEFFDIPEKVEQVLEHIKPMVKPGHMLIFPAEVV